MGKFRLFFFCPIVILVIFLRISTLPLSRLRKQNDGLSFSGSIEKSIEMIAIFDDDGDAELGAFFHCFLFCCCRLWQF